ncbi:MAG: hypothetical protein QG658_477 [Patescibacteria group bacterium]|nr:hypothetical protein [Patescibacteria group bacterium]
MRFPLNAIHWYLALPFLIFIAWRSFSARNSGQNKLNTYFGLSAVTFIFSMLCYGLPPLVASETSMWLTYGTIAGDIFQFIALFWIWLAVARIYFPRSSLALPIIAALDAVVVLIGAYYSITENLASPVTMTFVDGAWQVNFAFSQGYQVVTAIQFLSLLFIAARFGMQAWTATDVLKKIRLFSLALVFFVVGGLYVLRPILNFDATAYTTSYAMAGVFTLVVVFLLAGVFLARRGDRG